jgi:prevent-host-death family protein
MSIPETSITAADLRANLFRILNQVEGTHEAVIITKHGKPVAKLVHIEPAAGYNQEDPLLGAMAGTGRTIGDLTKPFCDPMDWDANRD